MKPKEANLCPIRIMTVLRDIHQVKAFLGYCQQMAGYVKEYAILASPLHKLTKKNTTFPRPWAQGSDYDLAFMRLKAILLDTCYHAGGLHTRAMDNWHHRWRKRLNCSNNTRLEDVAAACMVSDAVVNSINNT
jgi:hypothetical protein